MELSGSLITHGLCTYVSVFRLVMIVLLCFVPLKSPIQYCCYDNCVSWLHDYTLKDNELLPQRQHISKQSSVHLQLQV